jgi:hypothetical protein
MGIYNLNDLEKDWNNGITAVGRAEQIEKWKRGEITLGQIGLVMFAPVNFFNGEYPVREAGLTGTDEDLEKIESVVGEIKKGSFQVPFSNAGYLGAGWQASLDKVGAASEGTFCLTFGPELGEEGARLAFHLMQKDV